MPPAAFLSDVFKSLIQHTTYSEFSSQDSYWNYLELIHGVAFFYKIFMQHQGLQQFSKKRSESAMSPMVLFPKAIGRHRFWNILMKIDIYVLFLFLSQAFDTLMSHFSVYETYQWNKSMPTSLNGWLQYFHQMFQNTVALGR